jgi:hypothetical protein
MLRVYRRLPRRLFKVQRRGRRVAAQRGAGLLGCAHQGVGIVRMFGFLSRTLPGDVLERSLHALQKLHISSV